MTDRNSSPAVQITGLHHVGLPVADFERALDFYTRVLGNPEHVPAPKAFAAQVRWLRAGDQHVHLIKYEGALAPHGPRHFAMHVNDVRAAKAHLAAQGFALDPAPFITNAERFYLNDPDGNVVELIQWFEEWGDGTKQ